MPDTNPKYGTVNIRFWDNATVSGGAFTATNLKSTGHTSWELGNLDSVITFNNPVTVTGTVILQEDSSDAAKGVKMVFNAGLRAIRNASLKNRLLLRAVLPPAAASQLKQTTLVPARPENVR